MEEENPMMGSFSYCKEECLVDVKVRGPKMHPAKKTVVEESDGAGRSENGSSEDNDHDNSSIKRTALQANNRNRKMNAVTDHVQKKPAWRKIVKDAAVIKPYEGELHPKGYVHSTIGFQSTYAKAVGNISIPPPEDPISQILKMMAPKLNEMAKLRRFKLQNFDMGPRLYLDKGRFAEIRRTTFKKESTYAIMRFVDHNDPLKIFKEVHTMVFLQNKRILNMFGAFHEQGVTNIVTELHRGTVRQHLHNLSEKQKVRFVIQLLEAVDFIHGRDIIHCRLNPESCFITQQNNLVIGDFSDSQLLPMDINFLKTSKSVVLGEPMYNDSLANRGFYSKATDCFSLGATIFEIETSQALMGYGRLWTDVPLLEYIEFAEKGRLRNFPPFDEQGWSGVEKKEKLDGVREPLYDRVTSLSLMFGKIVWDLVKDIKRRLTTQDILNDYRSEVNGLLKGVRCSRAKLDNDLQIGNVKPFSENTPPLSPSSVSEKVNIVMDMIYHDANLNLGNGKSDAATERQQSPLDQFKLAMDDLYIRLSVQAKHERDRLAEEFSQMMTEALKTSKIDSLETTVGARASKDIPSGKSSVMKGILQVGGTSTVKEHIYSPQISTKNDATGSEVPKEIVISENTKSSAPKPSLPMKSKPAQSNFNVKERTTKNGNTSVRSPTAKGDRGNPPFDGKMMRKEPRAQEKKPDGGVEKRAQKRQNGSNGGKKKDDELISDDESRNVERSRKKAREDEGCQGGTTFLSHQQRPRPAALKNLPPRFYEKNGISPDWRGYFDCSRCKKFWNVDWKLVQEHVAKCLKAKKEK